MHSQIKCRADLDKCGALVSYLVSTLGAVVEDPSKEQDDDGAGPGIMAWPGPDGPERVVMVRTRC